MEKAKILVVDDEQGVLKSITGILQDEGYQTVSTRDGKDALRLYQEESPDAIVLDIWMPDMDGIELLGAVKALDKEAVVIIITGYGTIESAVKAIRQGAYDYITKPVKMNELELVIDRALERRTLSKRLGIFRGLTLALIISVPLWLILGIVLALLWK